MFLSKYTNPPKPNTSYQYFSYELYSYIKYLQNYLYIYKYSTLFALVYNYHHTSPLRRYLCVLSLKHHHTFLCLFFYYPYLNGTKAATNPKFLKGFITFTNDRISGLYYYFNQYCIIISIVVLLYPSYSFF